MPIVSPELGLAVVPMDAVPVPETLAIPVPEKLELGCVCAECGHEQETMDPCQKCRSVRVVLISAVRDLFGENWRDAFKDEPEETP